MKARLQREGAVLDDRSRPLHFGDAAAELRVALESCVVADRSDLGRVLATGPDLLDLLHRLSTKAVRGLSAGRGTVTVLTTPKGRIVERLFVQHLGADGVLLVTGPGNAERAIDHLNRFTFAEQTGLEDVTAARVHVILAGPRAAEALRAAGLPTPEPCAATAARLGDARAYVLGHDGLSTDGYSVVAQAEDGDEIWAALTVAARDAGGRPAGSLALEARRVLLGLPAAGNELTEEHNPLEAGLWDAVDFDKGCYVGQEVVARLRTYDKVARAIRGFVFEPGEKPPAPSTLLYAGERRSGTITSALVPPGRKAAVALGYVKRGDAEPGTELRLGAVDGRPVLVRELPLGETP